MTRKPWPGKIRMRRAFPPMAIVLAAVSMITSAPSDTESISVLVSISPPKAASSAAGDVVWPEGFGRPFGEKESSLPSRIISVALPPEAEFLGVSAEPGRRETVPGAFRIRRTAPAGASSRQNAGPGIVEFIRTSAYRQYRLVDVRVSPFDWDPSTESLSYIPEVEIAVRCRRAEGRAFGSPFPNSSPPGASAGYAGRIASMGAGERTPGKARSSSSVEAAARAIIANYDQARSWYGAEAPASAETRDFVIITLDTLASAVAPLADWQRAKGRTVEVVTVSGIAACSPGIDLPEKIRNFLRVRYPDDQWAIQDVLFVGDSLDIPMRRISLSGAGATGPETDFYYAELSRPDHESWDSNGNGYYGENTDAPDYYAEINVGRIPWTDPDLVRRICDKSAAFEQNMDPSYKNNILLMAAFVDDKTDGAKFAEATVDSRRQPWMAHWSKTRLYEPGSSFTADLLLTHTNILSAWTGGRYAVVSWHSHGSPTGIYVDGQEIFGVRDCDVLNDAYPSIVSAAACSNSDTNYLNVGKALMRQGAVGFLGANKSAHYRSEWDDPGDGSDQSFKYFFLRALTSGESTQGQALQAALREMYVRGLWDHQGEEHAIHSSLWGNPDLGLALQQTGLPPDAPAKPAGPWILHSGADGRFSCETTDPDGDDVYYCWSWGDGRVEWTGPYPSGTPAEACHMWRRRVGMMIIRVLAMDVRGNLSDWSRPHFMFLSF